MYYVYVIYSEKFKKRYTGYCNDIDKRLDWHNELSEKSWTKKYRPWILIYFESFQMKTDAIKREKYLKTGVGRDFLKNKLPDYY